MLDFFSNGPELKFAAGTELADVKIEGLGSVFGVKDSHDDVVLPGAFAASLAERKAQDRPFPMYLEHSKWIGGSSKAIGVWDECVETPKGLQLRGRLIGNHPDVLHAATCVREKVLTGLSIAYTTTKEGIIYGQKASDPRRQLKSVGLLSVDLVADPSNPDARVTSIKSMQEPGFAAVMQELQALAVHLKGLTIQGDQQAATLAIEKAFGIAITSLTGSNSPTAEQRADLMGQFRSAYKALTGRSMPPGMKYQPHTVRDLKGMLQDGLIEGLDPLSSADAEQAAPALWKRLRLRDEGATTKAAPVPVEAMREIAKSFTGFSLPSL